MTLGIVCGDDAARAQPLHTSLLASLSASPPNPCPLRLGSPTSQHPTSNPPEPSPSTWPANPPPKVDRLVQLLETPAYTFLRLQLLHPARHPDLLHACYGLLMLLPQSSAFQTLHARLHAAPTLALLQLDQAAAAAAALGGAGDGGGGASAAAGAAARPWRRRSAGAASPGPWAPFGQLLAGFSARQEEHIAAEEQRRERGGGGGRDAGEVDATGRRGEPAAALQQQGGDVPAAAGDAAGGVPAGGAPAGMSPRRSISGASSLSAAAAGAAGK
jgi:vacuole morphology and inheritance protein 14